MTNNWNLFHTSQEYRDLFLELPALDFSMDRNFYDQLGD